MNKVNYPRYLFVEYINTNKGNIRGLLKDFHNLDEALEFAKDYNDYDICDRLTGESAILNK